jgi:hypothetical protein
MRDTLLSSVAAIALAFSVTAAAQTTSEPRRDDQAQRVQTDGTQRDQSPRPTSQSQSTPAEPRASNQQNSQQDHQVGQAQPQAGTPQGGTAQGGTQGQSQQGAHETAPAQSQQDARAPQQSAPAQGGTQGQSQQGARETAPAQNRQDAQAPQPTAPAQGGTQGQSQGAQAPQQGEPQQDAQSPRQGNANSQAATRESNQPDASGRIELGEQQQSRVSSAIRQQKIEPVTNLNFAVSVGTAVPSSVRLTSLPTELADVLPQYRSYSFFLAQREVVIVDPQSFRIVALVPVSGGATVGTASSRETVDSAAPASAPKTKATHTERRRARATEEKPRFTDRERDRRRSVETETDVTVGASRREPDDVEELPPGARRLGPPVRRYRDIEPEDRGRVVIEPAERPRSLFPLFDIFR